MTDDVAATRRSYDEGADRYVAGIGTAIGPATETADDQAVLVRFGERVAELAVARVADVGCGPGRAGVYVRDSCPDLEVVGVDLSLGLLREGRRAHPTMAFAQGVLASLPLRSASVGGVVAWYSIIHTAPDGLATIAGELARALVPGGCALVAFQAGGGEAVSGATARYLHDPDDVVRRLDAAGLRLEERTVRNAELAHEASPQAFILARRASSSSAASGTTR